jgi:bla regulator protein BlaR1
METAPKMTKVFLYALIFTMVISGSIYYSPVSSVALASSDDDFKRIERKVVKPIIISTSYYDIDHDGKKEVIEIIMNKGIHIISDEEWCGGNERWEGDFIIRVRKGQRVLFKRSLNEIMGQHETLSFWAPKFSLVFRDYNGDGQIDFNLGQYGDCGGNDFWLFTITKTGKIKPLLKDGFIDYFYVQDPIHFNSTDDPILEPDEGLFKHTVYSRGDEVEYSTWYKWDGEQFLTVKDKEKSFRELQQLHQEGSEE